MNNKTDQNDTIDWFIDQLLLYDNLSINTLQAYRRDLGKLADKLAELGVTLELASDQDIATIFLYASSNVSMKPASLARLMSVAKRFYLQLVTMERRTDNPTRFLKSPKQGLRLPHFFSEHDVTLLLNAPDVETRYGLRDKAMLETLYATGLRVSEMANLTLAQLDLVTGVILTTGKGNKERIVPLGEIAQEWLERYLTSARLDFLKGRLCDFVFVSQKKQGISRQLAWIAINEYAKNLNLPHFNPHALRHAFATHLVNRGADLRSVQLLLGHEDISTTEIYTHVADIRLQALLNTHHPRG
ncbi:MAG: site-specific tyrosine recombinase XerD [Neisseriaceae bacterium]|nr:site-specific tyrosine recombinase XerD [Neisseriaceae bacterium]